MQTSTTIPSLKKPEEVFFFSKKLKAQHFFHSFLSAGGLLTFSETSALLTISQSAPFNLCMTLLYILQLQEEDL